jgi:uncharacterized membrane protein
VKHKTALKQSVGSLKFLAVVIVVMLALAVKYPSRYAIVPLVVFVAYFVMDALNVRYIRRKAAQDPRT